MKGIILQILPEGVEALNKAAEENLVFGILVAIVFALIAAVITLFLRNESKNRQIIVNKNTYTSRIEDFQKDYTLKIEQILNKITNKEEIREQITAQNQKETLGVLREIFKVLEVADKINKNDKELLIMKLNHLETLVNSIITNTKSRS